MSKYIAVIPRAAITRAALVEAGGRSMDQVKAACGCQYIINAWFYDTITGRPVGNLKIDGAVKASAGWNGWGLAWDKGEDISLEIVPAAGRGNYISGVELLTPTRGPGKALSYSPEYGGTRGRSAVLLAGARVILYCSGDGTADAKTPEGLRDELVSIGCRYDQAANLRALGLDAGSSSNCDFGDGQRISNGKRVKGYLCIWTTEGGTEPPPEAPAPLRPFGQQGGQDQQEQQPLCDGVLLKGRSQEGVGRELGLDGLQQPDGLIRPGHLQGLRLGLLLRDRFFLGGGLLFLGQAAQKFLHRDDLHGVQVLGGGLVYDLDISFIHLKTTPIRPRQ